MNAKKIFRFAPSPTGFLHLGGAKILYENYLEAEKSGGELKIRIDDTDQKRNIGNESEILADICSLGVKFTDVIYQSELLKDALEAADAIKEDFLVIEDNCRVIKIDGYIKKYGSKITFNGITFDAKNIENIVLTRSCGTPLYNFATVLSDVKMGVTHIIRGNDHVINTAKQIIIYRSMGLKEPKYKHTGMVLTSSGDKCSKSEQKDANSESSKLTVANLLKRMTKEGLQNYLKLLMQRGETNKKYDEKIANKENSKAMKDLFKTEVGKSYLIRRIMNSVDCSDIVDLEELICSLINRNLNIEKIIEQIKIITTPVFGEGSIVKPQMVYPFVDKRIKEFANYKLSADFDPATLDREGHYIYRFALSGVFDSLGCEFYKKYLTAQKLEEKINGAILFQSMIKNLADYS